MFYQGPREGPIQTIYTFCFISDIPVQHSRVISVSAASITFEPKENRHNALKMYLGTNLLLFSESITTSGKKTEPINL